MPKGVQIAIGAIACASLLGWYGYTNLDSGATFQYFQTLDEFLSVAHSDAPGRSLRIKGYVANGSIDRQVAHRQVSFAIQNDPPHQVGDGQATLSVLYPSLETPDLFQDGAEVVVEGRIEDRGSGRVFVAENVLAKCPSKFEAKAQDASPGTRSAKL